MSHTCKFCGKRYSGSGAFPSDWGWVKKTTWSKISVEAGTETPQLMAYCSEKCRREAEGGQGGGGGGGNSSSESSSSGSDSDLSPGCSSVLGKIITGVFVILGLIVVLAVIFGKNENPNDPAVKMEKWHEHLEKRRAAFAEGLPEEGVEARGFKNYTWEEWQAREKNANEKSNEKKIKNETKPIADLWFEHQEKRRQLLAQFDPFAVEKIGFESLTLDEFKARFKDKDVEAELKNLKARAEAMLGEKRSLEAQNRTTRPSAAVAPVKPPVERKPIAPASATRKPFAGGVRGNGAASAQQNGVGNKASKDSKVIVFTVQEKGKTKKSALRFALHHAVLKAVGTWVDSKTRMDENRDKVIAQVMTITENDVHNFEEMETKEQEGGFVVKARVSVSKKKIAAKFANIFPDVFTMPNTAATTVPPAPGKERPVVPVVTTPVKPPTQGDGANVTGHKASKDSKAIRIVVQGKGKTKDAAVRWALRDAVFKTVGTWVDSKSRIQENREKVVAQVKTITEADVPKFEVLETQEKDGGFVVKVRVSVSKKKIAPKFAEIFPDVFVIE